MNMNLQACSGLMMATGEEGEPPIAISNSWNDYIGGLHACFLLIEVLERRKETGEGRYLDLSQFECSVASIGPLVVQSAIAGSAPRRIGTARIRRRRKAATGVRAATSGVPSACRRTSSGGAWPTWQGSSFGPRSGT